MTPSIPQRPTAELIAELRLRLDIEAEMADLVRASALEKAATEAHDRLQSILKAWEAFDASFHLLMTLDPKSAEALRIAITGTSAEVRG